MVCRSRRATLEAFELNGSHWVLLGTLTGDAMVSLPPFEAICFSLADLWADDEPKRDSGRE